MMRTAAAWMGAVLIWHSAVCAAQQSSIQSGTPGNVLYRETVNSYCVSCHNDVMVTAGLSLEKVDVDRIGEGAETWEKVLRKLKGRSMPPAGMPRPDEATYDAFADYLEASLDQFAEANPKPGLPTLRRLNRNEYTNAINHLFAVKVDGGSILPSDDTMFGFDNVGDVLSLSPLFTEQYLAAARKIRHQVLGDPDMQPEVIPYTVPRHMIQDDMLSDDLPFGSRGGIAIQHNFPLDGEYTIQVRLQQNSREYIRGMTNKPHQLDIRLDDKRIKLLSIGGEVHGNSTSIFGTAEVGQDAEQEIYERTADETLEVRFAAKAGTRKVTVSFLKETMVPEEPLYTSMSTVDYDSFKGGVPGVRTVLIAGPYNARGMSETASRDRVLICHPDKLDEEDACAQRILSTLARRAYRRTATDSEISGLMKFYRQGHQQGGFEEGIGLAIERILAGPKFLFITELPPANVLPGQVFPISDHELATRLSLFLWSSIPDDTLLDLAESNRLSNPEVLEQQVRRMLDDSRSQALVDNFASQWLTLGQLNAALPDGELFQYFDENLRQALRMETQLFFEYVLKEDRPLLELLDADYSFVNERLAKHYNIPGIYGSHFRKISLPDETRGGLLGQGSILTVTSYANRTSPVIRGKWILENVLSAPPPAPPANVPGLVEQDNEGKVLTMREQMEMHRANPVCASCHKVMDPLGFALENYDAIGTWRKVDAVSGSPIDSTGALPDGTAFEGPVGLRKVLLEKRHEDFVFTVVEKLLTYALGKEVEHTNFPEIRAIMRETSPQKHSLSSIIMAITKSMPFQMRSVSHAEK